VPEELAAAITPTHNAPSQTSLFITATPEQVSTLADPIVTTSDTNAADPSPELTSTNTPMPTGLPLLVNPDTGETISVTWGDYNYPTIWPSLPVPPPLGVIPKPEGQVNIIILGNDRRSGTSGTRTDTIMLLTLNTIEGTASVTSFPRDLWVYAPGLTMLKFNTVWARGGYGVLFDTFEYNLGVRPDFYININRNVFVEVVDALGGIDVYVPYPLSDNTFAEGKFSVEEGWVHMDGRMARWYVSSRNTSSDFHRLDRQQAVLRALFIRLFSLDGVNRAEEIYNHFSGLVQTNLTLNDLYALAPTATQLYTDMGRVSRFAIGFDHVIQERTPESRAYILIPKQQDILQIMINALTP
jgi:LCP family protein required for cell wall assembly